MKKYSPAKLPLIKKEFLDSIAKQTMTERLSSVMSDSVSELDKFSVRLLRQFVSGEMIWVSREMTQLTVSAVDSLPEGTEHYPVEEAGLVLFEGSLGIEVPLSYLPHDFWVSDSFGSLHPPVAVLDGLMWSYPAGESKPYFMGFTMFPPVDNPEGKHALMIDVTDCYEQVEALVKTMWLLTSQSDIASERVERVAKGGGKSRSGGSAGGSRDVSVRFVSLRRTEREYTPAKDAQGKWKLDHRVLVRGHWRQQAYGKNRAKRRPVYIRPYIKGEDGKELVLRPVVKIWD